MSEKMKNRTKIFLFLLLTLVLIRPGTEAEENIKSVERVFGQTFNALSELIF